VTEAPGPTLAAHPFWEFSLALYAWPGVSEACLELQDRLGLDVNLLLFCCWAGRLGHRLEERQLRRLIELTGDWQHRAVRPLRDLRRWLKQQERAEALALREAVKEQELRAEAVEQTILFEAAQLEPAGQGGEAEIGANLALYLRLQGVEELDDEATLSRLATAAAEL
jgi:uncharacterized protein (TIGR02444 family)